MKKVVFQGCAILKGLNSEHSTTKQTEHLRFPTYLHIPHRHPPIHLQTTQDADKCQQMSRDTERHQQTPTHCQTPQTAPGSALCVKPSSNWEIKNLPKWWPWLLFSQARIISDKNIWMSSPLQFHFQFVIGYELKTVYSSSKSCHRISCNSNRLRKGCE